MFVRQPKSYKAVLCDNCRTKKSCCFLCKKETNNQKVSEAKICECCVARKTLNCIKCTKTIISFAKGYNYGVIC